MLKVTPDIVRSGICLVTLSTNSDHQNAVYGMFNELYGEYRICTVGTKNPAVSNPPKTECNFYVDCPDRPGIAKGTFDFGKIRNIVNAIKSTGCRTVYFESVHLWNCAIMFALGSAYTKITTLHDVVPHDGSKTVLLCQKLQSVLSDYVVIKSSEFMDDAMRLYGLKKEQVIHFGLWRDYPTFAEHDGDGSFLFFGRLRRYKGLENVLVLAKKCGEAQFKVIGSPDDESQPVVEELKRLPNTEVVARRVTEEEMAAYFAASSWVVLPYESASQSGVIIDAYKFGRPVIAYEVGAIASQVDNGLSGFLVPPSDIDAFANVVRKAQEMDVTEYRKMCKEAYSFGKARYSTESASQAFVETFNVARVDG